MIQEHASLSLHHLLSFRAKMTRSEYYIKMQEIESLLAQPESAGSGPVICSVRTNAQGMIADIEVQIAADEKILPPKGFNLKTELSMPNALKTHYSGHPANLKQCLHTLVLYIQKNSLLPVSNTCCIVFENITDAKNQEHVEADIYVDIRTEKAPPDYSTEAHKTFSRLGFALLVFGGGSIVFQILAVMLLSLIGVLTNHTISDPPAWVTWLSTFLPIYGIGLPLCLLTWCKCPIEPYQTHKLGARRFWVFFFACFPIMYVGNSIGNAISQIFSFGKAGDVLTPYVMDFSIYKILVMVILAPVFEELIFRKQLIDRCCQYGERTAIIFSALTFGLFHMNFQQFFYAAGLGALFAYLYIRTRRLRYCIILHMSINFLGAVVSPWIISKLGLYRLMEINIQDFQHLDLMRILPPLLFLLAYMALILMLCLVGALLIVFHAKNIKIYPASKQISAKKELSIVYGSVGVIAFIVLCLIMFGVNLFL